MFFFRWKPSAKKIPHDGTVVLAVTTDDYTSIVELTMKDSVCTNMRTIKDGYHPISSRWYLGKHTEVLRERVIPVLADGFGATFREQVVE